MNRANDERRIGRLLRVEEVAERLGVAPSTVTDWRRARRIPFRRLSPRCIRFVWSEVLTALAGTAVPASRGETADPGTNACEASLGRPVQFDHQGGAVPELE